MAQGFVPETEHVVVDSGVITNLSQMNGAALLMGNGVTGTGSQRVTVASDNTPFQVAASTEGDSIFQGTTARTPKFAFVNQVASTTGVVVAVVANRKIRVLSAAAVTGTSATNLTFISSGGAAKSCLFANAANGGIVLPFNPCGWFETVSGEGLSATTGAGSTTGIQVTYIEVV